MNIFYIDGSTGSSIDGLTAVYSACSSSTGSSSTGSSSPDVPF